MSASFGVVGCPVEHSLSPQIHHNFAAQQGIDLVYHKLASTEDQFEADLQRWLEHGFLGFNVTVPFKSTATRFCDTLSAEATLAGAVNTLHVAGGLHGDNTDGPGLVRDLTRRHGIKLAGKRLLIIGAGGATRGILGPLLEQRPLTITIANRTVSRAQALVDSFPDTRACSLHDWPQRGPFDLLIHATSAGHSQSIDMPKLKLTDTDCYDLSYGAAAAPFLQWARDCGAHSATDGLGMLVEQAALSFRIWHGKAPDTSAIYRQLRTQIDGDHIAHAD